jgi:hypothetical protein
MFLAMPLRASACASARSPERTSMHPLSVTTRSMSDVGRYSPVAKDPNTCSHSQPGGVDMHDTESAADSCMRLARFCGCCRVGHTNRLVGKDIDEDLHTRVLSVHSRVALQRRQCAKSAAATWTLARGQIAVMTPDTRSVATRRAAVSSGVGSRKRQNSAISAGSALCRIKVV